MSVLHPLQSRLHRVSQHHLLKILLHHRVRMVALLAMYAYRHGRAYKKEGSSKTRDTAVRRVNQQICSVVRKRLLRLKNHHRTGHLYLLINHLEDLRGRHVQVLLRQSRQANRVPLHPLQNLRMDQKVARVHRVRVHPRVRTVRSHRVRQVVRALLPAHRGRKDHSRQMISAVATRGFVHLPTLHDIQVRPPVAKVLGHPTLLDIQVRPPVAKVLGPPIFLGRLLKTHLSLQHVLTTNVRMVGRSFVQLRINRV